MTQISRIPLNKKVEERVYEVLMESIASAKTKNTVSALLSDLLSPTERLMLAKRLSIALLLMKKYDQRIISRWLKVSLGTVNKVSYVLQHGNGGYQSIIGSMLVKEELRAFIQKIDDTLANIMPPAGKNWTHWRQKRLEQKIKSKKAF